MCLSPRRLADGTEVSCRECWQCVQRAIDDWCGRCIAEKMTAKKTHSVTLTYGTDAYGCSDHVRAAVLTYSDVQKWFKLLAYHGYPARYLVAGEYGTLNRRAHWHVIIFWTEAVPKLTLNKRVNQNHWPHGYSFYENVTFKSVRYVCKYIKKNERDNEAQSLLRMSKKPPLGHDYFQSLAIKHVQQGIVPQTPEYTFPGVTRGKPKKPIQFRLKKQSLDNFLAAYVKEFERVYPQKHIPPSPLIDEYLDRVAPDDLELSIDKKIRYSRLSPEAPEGAEWITFALDNKIVTRRTIYDPKLMCYVAIVKGKFKFFERKRGKSEWRDVAEIHHPTKGVLVYHYSDLPELMFVSEGTQNEQQGGEGIANLTESTKITADAGKRASGIHYANHYERWLQGYQRSKK